MRHSPANIDLEALKSGTERFLRRVGAAKYLAEPTASRSHQRPWPSGLAFHPMAQPSGKSDAPRFIQQVRSTLGRSLDLDLWCARPPRPISRKPA